MTALLDIVDTAVKIGLGALISGVTTYFVTRKSHSHEKNADLIQYKRNMLLEISQLVDEAAKLRNDASFLRNNLIKINDFENEDILSKIGDTYWQSADQIRSATTKCYLINDLELAGIAKRYFEGLSKLYRLTIDGGLCRQDEYSDLDDLCNRLKQEILDQYSISLQKIHA